MNIFAQYWPPAVYLSGMKKSFLEVGVVVVFQSFEAVWLSTGNSLVGFGGEGGNYY